MATAPTGPYFTESGLYVYAVTYNASAETLTVGAAQAGSGANGSIQIEVSQTQGSVLYGQEPSVFDTSFSGVDNTYIGTVTLPSGITGFLVLATAGSGTGNYYVFTTAKFAAGQTGTGITYAVQKSSGVHDSGTDNWNLLTGKATAFCYMAGTAIRTPQGDVAVEQLAIGDTVTLHGGGAAAISWIGRQTVSTYFADALRVLPIRVKAGALGAAVPARDLMISPDHAILVDGILIQAGALVNGVSIMRETRVPQTFTYYHIEVPDHALILAENVPTETFIDNVDRMGFDNWAEHDALIGATAMTELPQPRAKAARQVPSATRIRLVARGHALYGSAAAA